MDEIRRSQTVATFRRQSGVGAHGSAEHQKIMSVLSMSLEAAKSARMSITFAAEQVQELEHTGSVQAPGDRVEHLYQELGEEMDELQSLFSEIGNRMRLRHTHKNGRKASVVGSRRRSSGFRVTAPMRASLNAGAGSFRVSTPMTGGGLQTKSQRMSDPSGARGVDRPGNAALITRSAGDIGSYAREGSGHSRLDSGRGDEYSDDFSKGLQLGDSNGSMSRGRGRALEAMHSSVEEETEDDLLSMRSRGSISVASGAGNRRASRKESLADTLPEIPPWQPPTEATEEKDETESDTESNASIASDPGLNAGGSSYKGVKSNQVAPDLSPIQSGAPSLPKPVGGRSEPLRPTTSHGGRLPDDSSATKPQGPQATSSAKVEPAKPVDGIVVVKASSSPSKPKVQEEEEVPSTIPGGGSMEEQLERMRKEHEAQHANDDDKSVSTYDSEKEDAADDGTDDFKMQSSMQMRRQAQPAPLGRKESVQKKASDFLMKARMREAFSIIDINNDGELDIDEMMQVVDKLKEQGICDPTLDEDKVQDMMDEVDQDGSGTVNLDEFLEMMQKFEDEQAIKGEKRDETQSMFKMHMSSIAKSVMEAHEKRNVDSKVVGDVHQRCIIHPYSDLHNMWDLFMAILILVTVVTVPLGLGWDEINQGFMQTVNNTIDILFCIDIIKSHMTGYVDSNVCVVLDRYLICKNYWMGWAIPDIASSIPYDLVIAWFQGGASKGGGRDVARSAKMVKSIRLLRVAKILRLMKLSSVYHYLQQALRYLENNYEIRFSEMMVKISRLFLMLLVLAHWIGCLNWMLCRLNNFPEDSWVVQAKLAGRRKVFIEDWEFDFYADKVQLWQAQTELVSYCGDKGKDVAVEDAIKDRIGVECPVAGTNSYFYWDNFGTYFEDCSYMPNNVTRYSNETFSVSESRREGRSHLQYMPYAAVGEDDQGNPQTLFELCVLDATEKLPDVAKRVGGWMFQYSKGYPSVAVQYGWSVFKALCAMLILGFEGPPMTNTICNDLASDWCKIEHVITLACLWIGALFYAFIVSTITTIITSMNVSRGRYEEKIMRAQEYMRHRKIPLDLRDKVRDFYAIRYPEGRVLEEDVILAELPNHLREELLRHAARELIQVVPMLSSSPQLLTHKFSAVIVPVVSFPEETLCQEGHYGDCMYFIHSGMVEIYSQYIDHLYHTIGDGCYFGDVAIMCHSRRTATCKARMHCILYELKGDQLFKVIADFPEVNEYMMLIAKRRQQRIMALDPEADIDLDDDFVMQELYDEEDMRTELFRDTSTDINKEPMPDRASSRSVTRASISVATPSLPPGETSTEAMATAATRVSKRNALRRSASMEDEVQLGSNPNTPISAHASQVQKKRRNSLGMMMPELSEASGESAAPSMLGSGAAAARRVSKQITGNITEQLEKSQAAMKKAAAGSREDRRRSTQLGAGIDQVNRGNRGLSTVKEDTAENLKRIRQMRIASQALRRASIDRGLRKQASMGADVGTPKQKLRRRSLVNLSPSMSPGKLGDDTHNAAGRTRKMSRSLTQENLDEVVKLNAQASTLHEHEDEHDSDHDSF